MGSDFGNLSSNCHAWGTEKEDVRKISVSDHMNGLQPTSTESDSFVVDMEKDVNVNSRFTLQGNLSRKVSGRGHDKKINPSIPKERDASLLTTSSPTATPHGDGGSSMPEKPTVVTLGPGEHSIVPRDHHHITINNTRTTAKGKLGGRQSSYRRSQHSWAISPRRILLFFATLASIGTILLICLTLSMGMGKIDGDGSSLDQ